MEELSFLNFDPIQELDNLEQRFNSPVNIFLNDSLDSPITTSRIENCFDIKIVNLTVTCTVNQNIFKLDEFKDNIVDIFVKDNIHSKIDGYSKFFIIKDNPDIHGRVFQSGKMMIYTKNNNINQTINKSLKELKRVYLTDNNYSFNYQNVSVNAILQFNVGFFIDYQSLIKKIHQDVTLVSFSFFGKVIKTKLHQGNTSGYIFHVKDDKNLVMSFTVYSTGKIQARFAGSEEDYHRFRQNCFHIYCSLRNIKNFIETLKLVKKKRGKKNIYNLTRKSSNIQLFCFGFCPNSKGILSSFHLAFSKTNFP